MRAYRKRRSGGQGRLPISADGLQVNFCRNLECANFGIPPLSALNRHDQQLSKDNYRASGSPHNANPSTAMICSLCGAGFPLKSNKAVIEEFNRQIVPFNQIDSYSCKSADCINSCRPLKTFPDHYQLFGKSAAGSCRYRCKLCKKTFSIPVSPVWRQRRPELNELILRLLVNKMPMRRICETASIEPALLYNRIDYIFRKCQAFSVMKELQLRNDMLFSHLRIAVDRQDHVFNWASYTDRRNTKLSAVGSADCQSGYVFGMSLDYDPDLNPYEVDLHARELGDYELAPPFRHYARIFLPGDYQRKNNLQNNADLSPLDVGARLPAMGMRIHAEYALMGHFQYLKWLLTGAQNIHFYLDQEPSIRTACLAAFQQEIKAHQVEAFFVKIAKELTVDEKKLSIAQAENTLLKLREKHPELSKSKIAENVLQQRYIEARAMSNNPLNRWVESVFTHMGEPGKHVLYLTDRGNADPSQVAIAMMQASLHPIDRFFMQIRRRISLLERPISTASKAGRVWHGYSGYNPYVAQKLMTIFRTIYNYSLAGKDEKTPAVRLGLAGARISYEDILATI